VNTVRKTRRTRVPEAAKELVLKRDKKFEKQVSLLSRRIQNDAEHEERTRSHPLPRNRYLQTVVR
jgi:hypothetical protein